MTAVHVTGSAAVLAVWGVTVAVALLVVVPVAVMLLHRTFRHARWIVRFSEESLAAARGIREHVGALPALETTVERAGGLVDAGGRLESKAGRLAQVLSNRRRR